MRDRKTNIAAWASGLCAIGFAGAALFMPLYSRLAVPDDVSEHPGRVAITLMQDLSHHLNTEAGLLMLFAALMLFSGLMAIIRRSAAALWLLRNISLLSLLLIIFARVMPEAVNMLPEIANGGFFPPPESQHMPVYDIQPEIGIRLAIIFAAAAFLISGFGRARAKKLLQKQTAAVTTETEGESSC